MGTWRKWAGFGVWCVVLFGGMILAGTGLWPLGAAAAAVGAVGLVLWGRRYDGGICVPRLRRRVIGAGLPIIQVEPGRRTKSCAATICGAMFPVEECRRERVSKKVSGSSGHFFCNETAAHPRPMAERGR